MRMIVGSAAAEGRTALLTPQTNASAVSAALGLFFLARLHLLGRELLAVHLQHDLEEFPLLLEELKQQRLFAGFHHYFFAPGLVGILSLAT